MRRIGSYLALAVLAGCAQHAPQETTYTPAACLGSAALPAAVAGQFDAIEDPALLQQALGEPEQGKLCQGQVYRSKADTRVAIFRAWNSTNPNSQYGQWWAFDQPSGPVAQYRADYEICYQWSPLDKLASCTLKAGTKVVVGTGQSAKCSEYLSYPVSETQQIFIVDAADAVADCSISDGMLSWNP